MKKGYLALLLALVFLLCACTQAPVVSEPIVPPQAEEQPVAETPLPVPEQAAPILEPPAPTKPEEKVEENTCTLSVRCDTIWENASLLDEALLELLPKDGVIYPKQAVVFNEGESVFDLLKRELSQNAIHFEFSVAPMYDSAYIEGIANLYEFDCGNLSGWMYAVNGMVPEVGISAYPIASGDEILLWYTCDLGEDLRK